MSALLTETPKPLRFEMAGIHMSPEEFDAIEECDESYRYEVINGVLVVTPPPLEAERDPNEELGHWLRQYHKHHPQGRALDKTLPEQTVRTSKNRRRADRVIWAGLGRVPDPNSDQPTIVAEFVSAGKRDQLRDDLEKMKEYMECGIAEYWVIDRFRRLLTVYRNRPAGTEELVLKEGEIYRTPLLPGFELPLAGLLVIADSWNPAG